MWLKPVLPLQEGSQEESEFHLRLGAAGNRKQGRWDGGPWRNSEQNKVQDLSYRTVICYKDATRIVLIPYFISIKGGDNVLTSFLMSHELYVLFKSKEKKTWIFHSSFHKFISDIKQILLLIIKQTDWSMEQISQKNIHWNLLWLLMLKFGSIYRSRAGHRPLIYSVTILCLYSACLSVPEQQSKHGTT